MGAFPFADEDMAIGVHQDDADADMGAGAGGGGHGGRVPGAEGDKYQLVNLREHKIIFN